MLENLLNPWARSGIALVLLFLIRGFSDGWAVAAQRCLALAHTGAIVCFVVRVIDAESLPEVATDRYVRLFAVLSIALGLAVYFIAGSRFLGISLASGAGLGAIMGLVMRFGTSKPVLRLDRAERRFFRRIGKQLKGRRRPKDR